jgi:hypothetical protein
MKEEKNVIVVPSFYIRDYDKNRGEVFEYRKEMATTQAINEDYDLNVTITNDMGEIWHEVGGQDGMYDNFPIKRIYRDNGIVRVYAIDDGGGVAIIASGKNKFQILTLGEDDGWHFLNSSRIYETFYGNKTDFVYLISEALSLFNNIEL